MTGAVDGLAFGALLGAGLTGGVFFAFSTFMMAALDRLGPSAAVAAMNSINRVILNPWFLGLFLGTGAAGAAAAALAWMTGSSAAIVAGGALYLAGSILVTGTQNVPLNDALARVEPGGEDAMWRLYRERWTRWNHVRTAACAGATALFAAGLAG